jgi:AcrR family transcriptional regulator
VVAKTGRGPGRPAGGEPTIDRAALLDAAERVIAERGSGATLEVIAAEAGVSKPIVYARVGSRADLCDALTERFVDRMVTAASGRVDLADPSRAGMVAFYRVSLETIEQHRSLFEYLSRGAGDDAADRMRRFAAQSAEPLAELLARWRVAAGADPSVGLTWAYGIVGMVNMVALRYVASGDGSPESLAEQLADLTWPGLRGPV